MGEKPIRLPANDSLLRDIEELADAPGGATQSQTDHVVRGLSLPSRQLEDRSTHLFVLPPRSPKLNGAVERANRTHSEEFYQITPCSLEMKKLNRELRQSEKIYNTVRPHQALGYLTPQQFLRQNSSQRKE
jgi:transposase InsO family protein